MRSVLGFRLPFFNWCVFSKRPDNSAITWFKHILLVNTKGSGVTKLRRKPSPTYTHTFITPVCSHTPTFLHPYVPTYTPLCSYVYTPMFLHPYVPTTYVPTPLCSYNLCSYTPCSYTPMFLHPMFLHPYVPTPLCSYAPMFLHLYVPSPLILPNKVFDHSLSYFFTLKAM